MVKILGGGAEVNVEMYHARKKELLAEGPRYRQLCAQCIQPEFSCYCGDLQKFDPGIKFVILIHPIEVRRRIATGRMSYLCLENSHLIAAQDYSDNAEVNNLLADESYHAVILFPGKESVNLSELKPEQRGHIVPAGKKLMIFVIDGTWATTGKMMRSKNLRTLPQICFSPTAPSNFRVRKQPAANYYSTIEAIHQTIALMGPSQGFDVDCNEHDKLLHVFNSMVERQLECKRKSEEINGGPRHRRICRKPSAATYITYLQQFL